MQCDNCYNGSLYRVKWDQDEQLNMLGEIKKGFFRENNTKTDF